MVWNNKEFISNLLLSAYLNRYHQGHFVYYRDKIYEIAEAGKVANLVVF